MKLKDFWGRVPLKSYVYLSLGVTLLTSIAVLVMRSLLPPEVPLFYGKPTGEEQLTSSLGLLIAPGVSLLVNALNTSLSTLVENPFLKNVLIISALFVSLLTGITVFKIIFLVGLF